MIDPRKLHLKIRVRVLRPMPAATVRLLLDRAFEDGESPPGIEIHGIDWEKGDLEGDAMKKASLRTNLAKFYGAMAHQGHQAAVCLGGEGRAGAG